MRARPRTGTPWLLLGLAGLLLAPEPVRAQAADAPAAPGTPATLAVSGELSRLSSTVRGFAGGVDWLAAPAPGRFLVLGAGHSSLTEVSWTFGRVGGSVRANGATTVHAQLDLGRGHDAGGGFPYVLARGGVDRVLGQSGTTVQLEDLYVRIDTTAGHVAKMGVHFSPAARTSVEAAVRSSLGGALGTHTATVRVDGVTATWAWFAGTSLGVWRPSLSGVSRSGPVQDMAEAFGGVSLPVSRGRVTLGVDVLRMPDVKRLSVVASWTRQFPKAGGGQ